MGSRQTQAAGECERALDLMRKRDAIGKTLAFARDYARAAQETLREYPDNAYRTALHDLAVYVVERVY